MASRYDSKAQEEVEELPELLWLSLEEIRSRFVISQKRAWLIEGFIAACAELRRHGCGVVYLGGSFVDEKNLEPGDYDACFDTVGLMASVDEALYLPDLEQERREKYRGDWLPGRNVAGPPGKWLRFLGTDRRGNPRKLIALKLRLDELTGHD